MTDRPLSHKRPANLERFYYGSTYYPEHWDEETRADDAQRMADAGFNCIRMAEFAWNILEAKPGQYDFAIFDETVARMGEKGIYTILCTPTPTPPRWLTKAHPEILRVDEDGRVMQHGSRQHVCTTNALFREHSRGITAAMADHYRDNPYVIGWQTDNELNCHFSECHCESCQADFREFLRQKYDNDIDSLNTAWGTAFWALTFDSFDDIITPKNAKPAYANPAHLLDYHRFISWSVSRFQHEQVEILRAANSEWFVTHNGLFKHIDYRGRFGQDLDFIGYDIYPFFDYDPDHRPYSQAFNLDHARAWGGNFLIPEQQSGPGGQGDYFHDNPEPGELKRMAYTSIAHGADSLLFFRWRTARFGAEEYWCGIFDHDNERRQRYNDVKTLGNELQTIGEEVLGTHVRVDLGIAAADQEVYDAHSAMTMGLPSPKSVAEDIHEIAMWAGFAVGCVHPSDDLSGLKGYIIPHWAMFDPAWLPNLQAFVENGGTLIIGARTATKDMQNNVVADTPPGVLTRLAGIKVDEYGRQNAPDKRSLMIKFDEKVVHQKDLVVQSKLWYESLRIMPGSEVFGRWNNRHLRRKPAASIRKVGEGSVIYVGTYLTQDVIAALLPILVARNGLTPIWPEAPEGVNVVVREDDEKLLYFFINNTDVPKQLKVLPNGINLVTGQPAGSRRYARANEAVVIKVKK